MSGKTTFLPTLVQQKAICRTSFAVFSHFTALISPLFSLGSWLGEGEGKGGEGGEGGGKVVDTNYLR